MTAKSVRAVLLVIALAAAVLATSGEVSGNSDSRCSPDIMVCKERPYGIQNEFAISVMEEEMLSDFNLQEIGQQYLSKEKLLKALDNLCTRSSTAGLACFQRRISQCSAAFKTRINNLTSAGVTFTCQPGGRGAEPALSHVINSITDEEIAWAMAHPCQLHHRSCFVAFGTQAERESLTLEALVAFMQRGITSFVRCNAEDYEPAKVTCPYWRADLLLRIISLMSYPFFGLRMTFTQQEFADMFQME